MNTTSDHFVDAAQEMQQQAAKDARNTSLVRTLLLALLIIASALLAIPTGLVLIAQGWPTWLAFPVAFLMHAALGFFVDWSISHRKKGNNALATLYAVGVCVFVLVFLVVAFARAASMIEAGTTPAIAWVLALVYFLVECAIPIGLGAALEAASERADDDRREYTYYRRHTGLIDKADEDAPGAWEDAEEKLKDQIREAKRASTGHYRDQKLIASLKSRLRNLFEHHPGKRYRDLNSGQDDSPASGTPVTPRDTPPPDRHAAEDVRLSDWQVGEEAAG